MRFPLYRSGNDDTPVAWWEILCAPVVVPILLLGFAAIAVLSIPATLLYPERKVIQSIDEDTAEGRELLAQLNRQESQTPFWRRLAAAPLILVVVVVTVPVLTVYDMLFGWGRRNP
jgi:hypothetical protein